MLLRGGTIGLAILLGVSGAILLLSRRSRGISRRLGLITLRLSTVGLVLILTDAGNSHPVIFDLTHPRRYILKRLCSKRNFLSKDHVAIDLASEDLFLSLYLFLKLCVLSI